MVLNLCSKRSRVIRRFWQAHRALRMSFSHRPPNRSNRFNACLVQDFKEMPLETSRLQMPVHPSIPSTFISQAEELQVDGRLSRQQLLPEVLRPELDLAFGQRKPRPEPPR